jgi:hypothetical protein
MLGFVVGVVFGDVCGLFVVVGFGFLVCMVVVCVVVVVGIVGALCLCCFECLLVWWWCG